LPASLFAFGSLGAGGKSAVHPTDRLPTNSRSAAALPASFAFGRASRRRCKGYRFYFFAHTPTPSPRHCPQSSPARRSQH
jgi:hypothetical protein